MKTVVLARIIALPEVSSLISLFMRTFYRPIAVKDEDFNLLLGSETDSMSESHPVECGGSIIGWVSGMKEASLLASLISYAAAREHEKQVLTQGMPHPRGHEALLENEEIYRNQQFNDLIYYVDSDLRVTSVSPSIKGLLGYLPEELKGKKITELGLLTDDSLARAISTIRGILNGGKVDTSEYELIAKDGTVKVSEITCTPSYTDGRIVSLIAMCHDSTARKTAGLSLSTREERFRAMADSISDGLIITEEGKTVYVNNRACEICGYSREELLSLWGPDLTAPQDIQHKEQIIQSTRESGSYPEQVDTWICRKDGTQCCVNLRFSFGYSGEGSHTGYVVITDITERKRAEERNQATMNFLDNIIESSLDAIVISDSKGFINRVNKAFVALTGRSEAEVYGKRMSELLAVTEGNYEASTGELIEIGPDYMDYTSAMLTHFINEKKIANWESYLIRKDGKAVPVDINIVYLYDKQGAITGTFGILRDATERKKIEKQIIETRDFLENIIESSLDPIVIGDNLGNIARVNKAFVQLVGYREADLKGKHLAELVPPEPGPYDSTAGYAIEVDESYYDRTYGQMLKLLEEGYIASWESYYFSKNRKVIPVEQTMFYLYDKRGKRIAVVSISRDISERKRVEHKLIATGNFLEDIIRTSADGIIVADTLTTITLINDAAERILGYSKEELLGRRTHDFIPSIEWDNRDKILKEMVSDKKSVCSFEHSWVKKDGTIIELSLSVGTMKDSSGTVTGFVVCARDITEHKETDRRLYDYQNQLRRLASQLTLAEEQERRRLATEIHDRVSQSLALAKIKLGGLEARLLSKEKGEELPAIRSLLEQSIHDTRSLVFDLSPPFLYEFGLQKALEWLLEDIEKQHGVRTQLVWDDSTGSYDDDVRILLYQSIRELLINVVKHAQAKTAKISLRKDDKEIQVRVEDNGRGFVINPNGFQVGKEGGYGLFSIQERLHHLGGSLRVESGPRQGTTIALQLPLVRDRAEKERAV